MKTKSRLCISRIYYWEKIYVLIPTRKSRGHIKEDLDKQTTERPRSSMYGVCGTQYDMHWRYLLSQPVSLMVAAHMPTFGGLALLFACNFSGCLVHISGLLNSGVISPAPHVLLLSMWRFYFFCFIVLVLWAESRAPCRLGKCAAATNKLHSQPLNSEALIYQQPQLSRLLYIAPDSHCKSS